ncbi:uncharacterized protein [Parasteatoda tepidariorum]|uniref:uncharacterized protein n=1 Tax=Parasteatoda tepidariorum TaxID=114398 RepID=UPI0039BCF205
MSNCRPVHTPILKEEESCTSEEESETVFPYREAVGALMYLMMGTRLDLAYAISVLSRYKIGILECFSDADFGGCTKTGRSTSGVLVLHAGGAISWLSQRQTMVAISTAEAEIVAANEATKELIWLKRLFNGISSLKEVPTIFVDNSAAVRLAHRFIVEQSTSV